jgi:hypothetical protein
MRIACLHAGSNGRSAERFPFLEPFSRCGERGSEGRREAGMVGLGVASPIDKVPMALPSRISVTAEID